MVKKSGLINLLLSGKIWLNLHFFLYRHLPYFKNSRQISLPNGSNGPGAFSLFSSLMVVSNKMDNERKKKKKEFNECDAFVVFFKFRSHREPFTSKLPALFNLHLQNISHVTVASSPLNCMTVMDKLK